MTREDFRKATKPLRDKLDNNEEHVDYSIATDSVRALLDIAEEELPSLADEMKKWTSGPLIAIPDDSRDKFATAALTGLISNNGKKTLNTYEITSKAYKFADTMIKARNKASKSKHAHVCACPICIPQKGES